MRFIIAIFPLVLVIFSCAEKKSEAQSQNMSAAVNLDMSASELKYKTYCNSRYDFCIDYPANFLFPQPESDNGDGRSFWDKANNPILTVYGTNNIDEKSLKEVFQAEINEVETLTYQKLGKNFFVLSGYRNSKIYYEKVILKEGNLLYAILEYNVKQKNIYDSYCKVLFDTFK